MGENNTVAQGNIADLEGLEEGGELLMAGTMALVLDGSHGVCSAVRVGECSRDENVYTNTCCNFLEQTVYMLVLY